MNVKLIAAEEINTGLRSHLTVAEAAAELGVSESTIRRAAKRAGVKRIARLPKQRGPLRNFFNTKFLENFGG